MRIRMMADGRVLEGTAKQIAEAMHALALRPAYGSAVLRTRTSGARAPFPRFVRKPWSGRRTARSRSTSTGPWTRPGA